MRPPRISGGLAANHAESAFGAVAGAAANRVRSPSVMAATIARRHHVASISLGALPSLALDAVR